MTKRARRTGIVWLMSAMVGFSAWGSGHLVLAQAPKKPDRKSFSEQFGQAIERARRRVETLYVLRLSETLALSPEHSAQVAAVIRKAQESRRGLLEERRQTLQDLNALLVTGAGADRIKPKVAQWEQNESRLGRWRQALFQDLSKILSAEQQGRYLIFDENFNDEVRNAVFEVRGGESQQTKE